MLSPLVCVVLSCPFCVVLSALSRLVRFASVVRVLYARSSPFRLSSSCRFDLSRVVRLVSSCLFLCRYVRLYLVISALSGLVRPFSSCPSCHVLAVMPSLTRPVRFVWFRLCFLPRHVCFVSSCPSCFVMSVFQMEQSYVGGMLVYSANVVILRSLWPDVVHFRLASAGFEVRRRSKTGPDVLNKQLDCFRTAPKRIKSHPKF